MGGAVAFTVDAYEPVVQVEVTQRTAYAAIEALQTVAAGGDPVAATAARLALAEAVEWLSVLEAAERARLAAARA